MAVATTRCRAADGAGAATDEPLARGSAVTAFSASSRTSARSTPSFSSTWTAMPWSSWSIAQSRCSGSTAGLPSRSARRAAAA